MELNIEDLTLRLIREIQALTGNQQSTQSPFKVGEKWLFRTVTHIDTGEITAINGDLITLKNAAWIADTGRYSDALKDQSKFSEVEPYYKKCVVSVSALIDATPITELPLLQK